MFLVLAGLVQLKSQGPVRLDPFHSIVVSGGIVAELKLSGEDAFEVDFKGADPEDLVVEVLDSVLKFRMKTGNYKDARLNVIIHVQSDFRYLETVGQGQIWSADEINLEHGLRVKMARGGEMRFHLNCDSLNARLSQGSVISLEGQARVLNLKVSTYATFSGYEFNVQDAEVESIGNGRAKVSVSNYLKANASTKGFIGYVGEPRKTDKKTNLGGEIKKTFLDQ